MYHLSTPTNLVPRWFPEGRNSNFKPQQWQIQQFEQDSDHTGGTGYTVSTVTEANLAKRKGGGETFGVGETNNPSVFL